MLDGESRYANRTGSPEFARRQEPDEAAEDALTDRCVAEMRGAALWGAVDASMVHCLCGVRIPVTYDAELRAHASTCAVIRREWRDAL